MSLHNKPVFNLKSECLRKVLLSFLEKSKEHHFKVISMKMDGASMSTKVAKVLLKELISEIKGNITPITRLKLEVSLTHDGST